MSSAKTSTLGSTKLHETRLIVQEHILVRKSSWKLRPLSFTNIKPNTSHLD